ncbi:MAG: Holliday junction resolvase RuvX, partial [Pseudomonadota bacterium]|nr:Holliday junction resolvase RuvX [Pseudomonadota bacterium]
MDHRKPAENPRELAAELKFGQRLLGLDVGAKTIGIALSDVGRTIATPTTTIRRTKFRDDVAQL